jgi:GTP-binding protein
MNKVPPLVAIVGKPNSGKSTLFNRITTSRKAITHHTPGVTRDIQYDEVEWEGVRFRIADTGGFSLDKGDDLQQLVSEKVRQCAREANVILLVMDVRTGPTAEDEEIIESLRKYMSKIITVVNKVERRKDRMNIYEFQRFGFDEIIPISAVHGTGVSQLMDIVAGRLPTVSYDIVPPALKISIVGKPNVGKSSLVNKLTGDEHHIVSEIPSTTRDSIDIRIKYYGKEVVLVDTAGLKRKARIDKAVEKISSLKSLDSIRRSDIVLFLLDGSKPISRQDNRIASEVHESGRGLVIIVNKWDLLQKEDRTYDDTVRIIRDEFPFIQYAPIVSISAKTGLRTERIIPLCFHIQEQRSKRIRTTTLNSFMKDITDKNPPPFIQGKRGKIYYATQTAICPPTFTLFVNKPLYFRRDYIGYITNQLRKVFTFSGTNIRIALRSRDR